MARHLFLYGPPGSGKSTLGRLLAGRSGLPLLDLDTVIREAAGRDIPQIFAEEGEKGFRARELRALEETAARKERCVVALGGGALLNPAACAVAEANGAVLCLACSLDVLLARVGEAPGSRPLVAGGASEAARKLAALMDARGAHYASFPRRLDVSVGSPETLCDRAEELFGLFKIDSGDVPSTIRVGADILDELGPWTDDLALGGRAVVVCDAHTAPLYGARVADALRAAGRTVACVTIPAGEETKNLDTVQRIWRGFLDAGLGRDDFAVAVGGGVTGDLTGFAAATWMRGIRWINVPTTLLAMVDASTGGKTGCDLPEAKNMVGAFHAPSLVLADVRTLASLPAREWRCGLAEAVKHDLIAAVGLADDLVLFAGLRGVADDAVFAGPADIGALARFVSRALAVKVRCVREDPLEKSVRGKLNLGHTVGHALEVLTNFSVKHGEGVAIGTVEEARLAVRLGHAPADWPDAVAALFASVGLPVEMPAGLDFAALVPVMKRDKKKKAGVIRFALPYGPGNVTLTPVEL